jgi:hypothetical protein
VDSAIAVALISAVGVIGASALQAWNNKTTIAAGDKREALLRQEQESRWENERLATESTRRFELEQATLARQNDNEEARRAEKLRVLTDFVKIAQLCYGQLYTCLIAKGDPLTNSSVPLQSKQINLLNEALGALSLHTGDQQLSLAREIANLAIAMNVKVAIDEWRQEEAVQRLSEMEQKLGQMSSFLL